MIFYAMNIIDNKDNLIELFGMYMIYKITKLLSSYANDVDILSIDYYNILKENNSPYYLILHEYLNNKNIVLEKLKLEDINRFVNHIEIFNNLHIASICASLEANYAKQLPQTEIIEYINHHAKYKNHEKLQTLLTTTIYEIEYKEFQNIEQLAEELPEEYKAILEDLVCPITHGLMCDPVIASDGITYERSQIEQYLLTNNISPITRQPITKELIPNMVAKKLIRSVVATVKTARMNK
jgi:hypothetical protein